MATLGAYREPAPCARYGIKAASLASCAPVIQRQIEMTLELERKENSPSKPGKFGKKGSKRTTFSKAVRSWSVESSVDFILQGAEHRMTLRSSAA